MSPGPRRFGDATVGGLVINGEAKDNFFWGKQNKRIKTVLIRAI